MKLRSDLRSNSFFSPAKINVFFRVLGKRRDGFHEIASLMKAVSLGDTLHFEVSDRDRLTCSDPQLDCGESNLVAKGIKLFRMRSGVSFPIKTHLEKKIPVGSGLGGGSSNLATTLWALNQYLKTPYSPLKLMEWSGSISSDAPFFFSHGSACVQGRGERVARGFPISIESVWLASPSYALPTRDVFEKCRVPKKGLSPHAIKQQLLSNSHSGVNDLEAAAFKLQPSLETLKKDLLALGFEHVVMTGSGTTFYCLGEVETPCLPHVSFFPVSFLERTDQSWYSGDYEKTTL